MSNNNISKQTPSTDELIELIQQMRSQQEMLRHDLANEQSYLQSLAQKLWLQQEHERARLSRELHDGLGQLLTGIKVQLEQLSQPVPAELNQAAELALASVRQISRLLHPTILDDLGLEAAVSWLARQILEPVGVACDIQIATTSALHNDLQLFLYRVIQEALTNVAKYAKASSCQVYLSSGEASVRLDIIDNGVGFALDDVDQGVGLQSMRDRCAAFGAELTITSQPNRGCHIQVLLAQHNIE